MGLFSLLIRAAGWGWTQAVTDSALQSVLLLLVCYAAHTSLYYFRPSLRTGLLAGLAALAFSYLLVRVHAHAIASFSDESYGLFVARTGPVRVLITWLLIALTAMATWLWALITDREKTGLRQREAEQLAGEAELAQLRQQLQPHFIFNSLNSINALIGTQPENARLMVQHLSDFLRGSLRKDDKQYVPFRDELHHLQLYLEIEKVRFGHRLVTTVECDPACLDLVIPPFLLQPLVENAIKFGLYDLAGALVISVAARQANQHLELSVTNPFDPATVGARKGTGFGLRSISRRLYLLYARNDLMTTAETNNTFSATLRLPQPV